MALYFECGINKNALLQTVFRQFFPLGKLLNLIKILFSFAFSKILTVKHPYFVISYRNSEHCSFRLDLHAQQLLIWREQNMITVQNLSSIREHGAVALSGVSVDSVALTLDFSCCFHN